MHAGAVVAGKYRILDKLGEGGMGAVWRATNEVTERDFAIKFLHPGAASPVMLKRFFQEAKVAGRLRHPSIVEIFDAGTEPALGHAPYLVMELLDGLGLDEAIARAGRLPLGISLEIMAEISRALALAHAQGIVHRDLKPSNVFLHRSGSGALVPKVLDFGISKVTGDSAVSGVTTRTGAVMGSPLYMSPEQAAGDKTIDARSDVHSLAVMLWECLVGRTPFMSETYGLLIVEVISGARPRLADWLPDVPAGVDQLMSRAMALNRAERPANAGELADALEQQLAELRHEPVLSTRSGDARFFALLGASARAVPRSTTTTAAVEVPGEKTTPVVPEKLIPAGSADAAPDSIRIPTQKPSRALLLAAAAGALALLGAAAVVLVGRFGASGAEGPEPPPASAAPATRDTASASPVATTSVEISQPSAPDAGKPAAEAPKPRSPRPRTIAPSVTKPKASTAPAQSGAPVHRGVTGSGL